MLSTIVQSRPYTRNSGKRQRSVNSKRWDKAARWIQDRVSPQALLTYLVIQRITQGRPTRIPKRLLASRRGVSSRTIFNHTIELIEAKVLRAVYYRISSRHSAPNLYILLDIDGKDLHLSMEKNFHQKPIQTLKGNTPPRSARWVNDTPIVRKLHGLVHEYQRRLRKQNNRLEWQLERAHRRNRAAEGSSDWLNRIHGGKTWEERNPEQAAWFEREMAKQGVTR